MRDFSSWKRRLNPWLLGAIIFFFLSLWGSGWNISDTLYIFGAALICVGIPVAILFSVGLLVGQTVKTVVHVGSGAASSMRRRKGYPQHEWTNAEMLTDGRYIIGDDGELIELDIDEKRKHDDANN